MKTCPRCQGCGQIANSDGGEAWTHWEQLPEDAKVAVRIGLVYPIECPVCHGSGEILDIPDGDPRAAELMPEPDHDHRLDYGAEVAVHAEFYVTTDDVSVEIVVIEIYPEADQEPGEIHISRGAALRLHADLEALLDHLTPIIEATDPELGDYEAGAE